MLKTIQATVKLVGSNCDYWNIPRNEQKQWLDESLENVKILSKNKNFDLWAIEPLYTKGAIPRRGQQSTTGKSGTYQNMIDYVSDLHNSKYHSGDMSGRQITGLNHINEIIGDSEICEQVNLPHTPTVCVDKNDDSQLIYTIQGHDKRIDKKVYRRHDSSSALFHELFSI